MTERTSDPQTEHATKRVAMSACRLSDGRLHWGHINGCFSRVWDLDDATILFVIQDEGPFHDATMKDKITELLLLLKQLYSLPIGQCTILSALQSFLIPPTRLLH